VGRELGAEGARMTIDALLLRDVPEQRLLSMERLANEVERGFDGHEGITLRSMTVHEPALARRAGLGRAASYVTRFVGYPIAASRQRADVYHIVDQGYGHLAALLPGERVVVSCHDLMLLRAEEGTAGFRGGRAAVARFRWSTGFLRKAARVIVPTEATKRDAVRMIGVAPSRIEVVAYGVGGGFRPFGAERRAALKRELGRGAGTVLLHVSTGDPYKNVEGTLRALRAMHAAGVDATLARVGAPLTAEQRVLARSLGIEGRVNDCGHVSEERLAEAYNGCDVLLFPSFHEGYGWPPLEAMACGTPVVTSECEVLLETTGGAALHAPADDAEALARQARRAIEDEDVRDRLRRAGIERAAERTWERTIAGFAAAYTDVAERAAQRQRERAGRRPACAE